MQAFLENFFTDLGITITTLTIKEEADDLSVRIETPDSPLLIGIHGKNIEAFQHYLGRALEKKLGRFVHLHLEINDYMKAKDDRLFAFLDGKIAWVMESGKSTQIRNLSAFERKKAHNYIAEKKIEGIVTKSEGEAENRMLVLSYTGVLKGATQTPSSGTQAQKIQEPKAPEAKSEIESLTEDGVGI